MLDMIDDAGGLARAWLYAPAAVLLAPAVALKLTLMIAELANRPPRRDDEGK